MKYALIGYGKMGKEIEQVIHSSYPNDEIVLKISEANLHEFSTENLQKSDVAIEFTEPASAVSNIYKCFDAGVPVVVGTTAWMDRLHEVKEHCIAKNGALFYSPNYSVGVNVFWEINKTLARLMDKFPEYNISIEEIHHTEKKDAPSGTAVKTAEVILSEIRSKSGWHLKTELESPLHELPIIAKREPNVPGTHTVTYASSVDLIEIKHEAKSRRGFAEGAVMAARFLHNKKGVYQMKDLLGLG